MIGPPAILGWGVEHPIGDDPWRVASWARVERTPTTVLFGTRAGSIMASLVRDDLSFESPQAEVASGRVGRNRTIAAAGRALTRALAMAGVNPKKTVLTLCLAVPPREERRDRADEVLDNAALVDALAEVARVSFDPEASRVFEGGPAAGVAAFIAARDRVAIDALDPAERVVIAGAFRPLAGTVHVDRLAESRTHDTGGGAFGSLPTEAAAFVVLGRRKGSTGNTEGTAGSSIAGVELVVTVPESPSDEPPRTDEESAGLGLRTAIDRLGVSDETWLIAAIGGAPIHHRIHTVSGTLGGVARRPTEAESNLGDSGAATAAVYVALACEMARHGCAPSRDAIVSLPSLLPVGALRIDLDVAPPPEPPDRTDAFGAASSRAARNALRDIAARLSDEGSEDRMRLLARAETSLAAFESGLRRDDEILGLLDEAMRDLRAVRDALDAEPETDLDEDEDETSASRERLRAACSDAIDALAPVRAELIDYLATPRNPPPERAAPSLHARDGVPPLDPFVLPTRVVSAERAASAVRRATSALATESAAHSLFYDLDRHRTMRAPADAGDGEAELSADARCAAVLDAIFSIRAYEATRRGGIDLVDVLDAFAPAGSPLPNRAYVRALVFGCTAGVEAARHAAETLLGARGGAREAAAAALVRGTNPDLDRAIESLLERRDAESAAAALGILRDRRTVRIGRAAPQLLRSDVRVRRAAACALGVTAARDAARVALGIAATTDSDEEVRDVALVSLARQGDPAAIAQARLLCAEQPRPRLLELLALAGNPDDADLLFSRTDDHGLELLGWYGSLGAAGYLCDVLDAERTTDMSAPSERARVASRALARITGASSHGAGLVREAVARAAVPSLLETRGEVWRDFFARAELPPAPRLRFGQVFERRAAAREIVLGGPAADRGRAELEASIGFRCGGAIPSPRGWLHRVREVLTEMGALEPAR